MRVTSDLSVLRFTLLCKIYSSLHTPPVFQVHPLYPHPPLAPLSSPSSSGPFLQSDFSSSFFSLRWHAFSLIHFHLLLLLFLLFSLLLRLLFILLMFGILH